LLAKHNVVQTHEHIDPTRTPPPQKRTRQKMIIKRPGRDQNIGDDLED